MNTVRVNAMTSRRQFFACLGALAAAPLVPAPVSPALPLVAPANGTDGILGIAAKDVRKGDFVQIITYGPVNVQVDTIYRRYLGRPASSDEQAALSLTQS